MHSPRRLSICSRLVFYPNFYLTLLTFYIMLEFSFASSDRKVSERCRSISCSTYASPVTGHCFPVMHGNMASGPISSKCRPFRRIDPQTQIHARRPDFEFPTGRTLPHLWKARVRENSFALRYALLNTYRRHILTPLYSALLGEADLLTGQMLCPRSPPDSLASFAGVYVPKEQWVVKGVCAYVPQVSDLSG